MIYILFHRITHELNECHKTHIEVGLHDGLFLKQYIEINIFLLSVNPCSSANILIPKDLFQEIISNFQINTLICCCITRDFQYDRYITLQFHRITFT